MTRLIAYGIALSLIVGAACGSPRVRAFKDASVACAQTTKNRLMDQAVGAFMEAVAKDPSSVGAFLDSLALDAAQVGVTDAVGFVVCVGEAAKAALQDQARTASLDQKTYLHVITGINSWEAEHWDDGRGER